MLPAEDIQQSLSGAWRLMLGKADGLKALDLSADGFWNSFFAILIAAPALIVGWVAIANSSGFTIEGLAAAARFGIVVRLALVHLGAWVLPLIALAAVAPHIKVADRFVHYVVASNWASAIVAWLMLPSGLLWMFVPDAETNGFVAFVSLILFGISMVLMWRMTNVVIGKGPSIGTAVFTGMFAVSLVVLYSLQAMLGL